MTAKEPQANPNRQGGGSVVLPVGKSGNRSFENGIAIPRPKGSKNRPALTIDERIAQVTVGIESPQEQIREKKAGLKQ